MATGRLTSPSPYALTEVHLVCGRPMCLGQRRAYKYVPYGPVDEVVPYLIRRTQDCRHGTFARASAHAHTLASLGSGLGFCLRLVSRRIPQFWDPPAFKRKGALAASSCAELELL